MNEQDYITQRLDDQQKWYSQKSRDNQSMYRRLRLIQIILAATLPFAIGYISQETTWLKILTGAMSILIAILEGVQTLFKYQDNWSSYRSTSEALKREKILFETHSNPYNTEGAFQLLVERVEAITTDENKGWLNYSNTEKQS